jgi:hypothetical protein
MGINTKYFLNNHNRPFGGLVWLCEITLELMLICT